MKCQKCGVDTDWKKWTDEGTCYDGCCDAYKCPNCNIVSYFEVGD